MGKEKRTRSRKNRYRSRSTWAWMRRSRKRPEKRCHYCKCLVGGTSGVPRSRDHIVPRWMWIDLGPGAKSYGDKRKNLVDACQDCNQKKGANWPTCRCRTCHKAVKYFEEVAKMFSGS